MSESYRRNVVEAALLAAGRSLHLTELVQVFAPEERPTEAELTEILTALQTEYATRALELAHTASGWRVQVRGDYATEVSRLWPERPARYSRALLETLALIAYRQPITRGEIELVRGVAVNPNIIKTLLERNWVRVIGTRDVPGRPEILGTTADFLDYFGLQKLDQLPPLAELKAMTELNVQLEFAGAAAAVPALTAAPAVAESETEMEAEEMNSEGDPLVDAADADELVAAGPDGPASLS
jgi:segregation and condensation protein B